MYLKLIYDIWIYTPLVMNGQAVEDGNILRWTNALFCKNVNQPYSNADYNQSHFCDILSLWYLQSNIAQILTKDGNQQVWNDVNLNIIFWYFRLILDLCQCDFKPRPLFNIGIYKNSKMTLKRM